MSCVVAVIEKGRMWMGADSLCGCEDDVETNRDPKCFIKTARDTSWLIGVVGVSRNKQAIHYHMDMPEKNPPQNKNLCGFIVAEFMPLLRKTLEHHGLIKKKDNLDTMEGGLIIAVHGRLFRTDERFHVSAVADNFTAIGSGTGEARGVLWTLRNAAPRIRIRRALEAAETYHSSVRRPFHIINAQI